MPATIEQRLEQLTNEIHDVNERDVILQKAKQVTISETGVLF